jgi:hypothetical protein
MRRICFHISAAVAGVPSAQWLVDEVGYLRIVGWDIEWMQQSAAAIDAFCAAHFYQERGPSGRW